jgi:hypothetical protein
LTGSVARRAPPALALLPASRLPSCRHRDASVYDKHSFAHQQEHARLTQIRCWRAVVVGRSPGAAFTCLAVRKPPAQLQLARSAQGCTRVRQAQLRASATAVLRSARCYCCGNGSSSPPLVSVRDQCVRACPQRCVRGHAGARRAPHVACLLRTSSSAARTSGLCGVHTVCSAAEGCAYPRSARSAAGQPSARVAMTEWRQRCKTEQARSEACI